MAATVPVVVPTGTTVAAAAFLNTCTAPSTRRSYTQTMTRLITSYGTAPVTALDGETLRELLTTSWDGAAPATWNRHLRAKGGAMAKLARAKLNGTDLADADLTGAWWPKWVRAPKGWKVDTRSGRLEAAGTDSGPAEAN